ncbi:hypothetical protein, partial [Rhizobium laguerreae]|uniref:hypothetical protein n=1 Tax=Rhizobium laguerreae TaxID=1076926 RepID=UPI0028C3D8FC
IVDHKAARNERRRPERMTHGADSLCETNISQHLISSKVSQSQICTPEHNREISAVEVSVDREGSCREQL